MITFKNYGEGWRATTHSIPKRVRLWLAWFGGWEKANSSGWRFRIGDTFVGPTPISILGRRATLQVWPRAWQVAICLGHEYLVIHVGRRGHRDETMVYLSPDCTPQSAHTFFYGAPFAVVKEAAEWRQRIDERMARGPVA